MKYFLIVTNLSASRGNECFPDLMLKAISFCKLIETYSATWDEDDKDLFFFLFFFLDQRENVSLVSNVKNK